jgi:hypothetical protein
MLSRFDGLGTLMIAGTSQYVKVLEKLNHKLDAFGDLLWHMHPERTSLSEELQQQAHMAIEIIEMIQP